MFLGLRTVLYHVNDIEKAKQWYSKILGIQPYFDQPYYVGFNVGGYELGLDPDPAGTSGKLPLPSATSRKRFHSIAIRLE